MSEEFWKKLVETDFLPPLPDQYGRLPLHVACENETSNENILSLISIYEKTVSVPSSYSKMYPLHYACKNPSVNSKVIETLLNLCVDAAYISDKFGNYPLHYACSNKSIASNAKTFQPILEANTTAASLTDGNQQLPLHIACTNSHCSPDVLQLLVDANNNAVKTPDIKNKMNLPLHYLVQSSTETSVGAVDKIKILMNVNREIVSMPNEEGDTPAMLAEKLGNVACLAYLYGLVTLQSGIDETDEAYFWLGIEHANSALVESSLRKDPTLAETCTKDGIRPFQYAIREGFKNIYDFLYEFISKNKELSYLLYEPNKEGRKSYIGIKGESPLQLALKYSRSDILNALLQNPLCLETATKDRFFFLGEALKAHDVATMTILIKALKWEREPEEHHANDTVSLTETKSANTWDLSNQNLEDIVLPPAIANVEIDTIVLSCNKFERFPLDILKIRSLTRIIIAHNMIEEIGPKVITALRNHGRIRKLDFSYNQLRAIPPELYSIPKCTLVFTKNPLSSSLVFPAWFFGITFGNKNRFVLLLIDIFFLCLILFLLLFGAVLQDQEEVRVIQTALAIIFFGAFVISGIYFGIGGIVWTDSLFLGDNEDNDDSVQQNDDEAPPVHVQEKHQNTYDVSVTVKTPTIIEWIEQHANIFALLGLAIEFPAVLSFSFDFTIPWPNVINKIFQFIIFNFPSHNVGYWFGFWVSVVFVIFQRIMLEVSRNYKFSRFGAAFLGSTISITALPLFVQLTKVMVCTYGPTGGVLDGYSGNMHCWSGIHLFYAAVGLISFVIYYPMAILSIPVWQQRSQHLTIKFPSYYLISVGQIKFLLAILTSFFTNYHWFFLSINLVANILLLALVGILPSEESLFKSRLRLGKLASRTGTIIGAILAFVVYGLNNQTASIIIFVVMVILQFVVFLGLFIYGRYFLKAPPPKEPKKKRRRARSRAKSIIKRVINI